MRVYSSVTINMTTMEVLEAEWEEWDGAVAECKGGGNSGAVDFPQYMKDIHNVWINHQLHSVNYCITDLMNSAWSGDTPFTSAAAYNPDADIAAFNAQGTALSTLVGLLSLSTPLDELVENVLSDTRITEDVDAFANTMDADLNTRVYPRFEAGMRDLNAVMSSAFVIGRTNLEEARGREVGKYQATLRLKAFGDDALQLIGMKLQYQQVVAQTITEQRRIAIVAKKEQVEDNMDFDVRDRLWDLEVYQHGMNVLGGIGGGSTPGPKGLTKGQSALGGAMAGAAVGTQVKPGWGTAIGAVVGGVAGYLSN